MSRLYPVVHLQCIRVEACDPAVRFKVVYLAIGITTLGEMEVLSVWRTRIEGIRFWLQLLEELRDRGVRDICVVCIDGLIGLPGAVKTIFPHANVQLCVVRMAGRCLESLPPGCRPHAAEDLSRIHEAMTADEAMRQLVDFESKWGDACFSVSQAWRRNWVRLLPFFDYPPAIRKVILAAGAIGSIDMSLHNPIRNGATFESDEVLARVLDRVLDEACRNWMMPAQSWMEA